MERQTLYDFAFERFFLDSLVDDDDFKMRAAVADVQMFRSRSSDRLARVLVGVGSCLCCAVLLLCCSVCVCVCVCVCVFVYSAAFSLGRRR